MKYNIYWDGKIYANVEHPKLTIDDYGFSSWFTYNHKAFNSYPISGPHNFKSIEDVTGRWKITGLGNDIAYQYPNPKHDPPTPPPVTEEVGRQDMENFSEFLFENWINTPNKEFKNKSAKWLVNKFFSTLSQDGQKVYAVDELKEQGWRGIACVEVLGKNK